MEDIKFSGGIESFKKMIDAVKHKADHAPRGQFRADTVRSSVEGFFQRNPESLEPVREVMQLISRVMPRSTNKSTAVA